MNQSFANDEQTILGKGIPKDVDETHLEKKCNHVISKIYLANPATYNTKRGQREKRKCKKALKGICEPNVWNMQSKSIIHTETASLSLP